MNLATQLPSTSFDQPILTFVWWMCAIVALVIVYNLIITRKR